MTGAAEATISAIAIKSFFMGYLFQVGPVDTSLGRLANPVRTTTRWSSHSAREEAVYVRAELLVVLPQEAVSGIRIDLDLRVGDEPRHQM